jgi:flagellar protein FliS
MASTGARTYQDVGTNTADPVTITTMLMEGSLKALRRARMFADQGQGDKSAAEAERAHLILGELLVTLDREQGEIAEGLASVYTYCLRCVTEGALAPEKYDEAAKHVARIAEAWKTATTAYRADLAAARGRQEAVA